MIVWKVLTLIHEGRFTGACMSLLEYKKGKATEPDPGCGPIAAFSSLKKALWFASSYHYIAKARAKKSKAVGFWFKVHGAYLTNVYVSNASSYPPGTVFCSKLTLLAQPKPVSAYSIDAFNS